MSSLSLFSRRSWWLLLTAWTIAAAGPAQAALNAQEQELANRVINDAGQSRASVSIDPILSTVARAKAADMANREYFAHTDPDGHGANFLVRQAGYTLPADYSTSPAANNIESLAAGYATVADVWEGWMDSPSHKTHILGKSTFFAAQTSLGVGFYQKSDAPYRYYWVILTAPASAPKLTIASPAAGAALTSSEVEVTGTMGGLPLAARVEVQLENAAGTGAFATATGTTGWSATVSGLIQGKNTIRVRSIGSGGNVLLTLAREVRLIVTTPLTVAIEGDGAVTKGFAGTSTREVGVNFTVTATPAAGSIFAGWAGGSSVTTPALTMRMAEGLTLTARFVANPFLTLKGGYNGLLESATSDHDTAGLVRVTLATTGAVSGKVTVGGLTYSFTGKLNVEGNATIAVSRGKLTPLTLTLDLDTTGGSERITGTVSDGSFTSEFSSDRAWQPGSEPSAYAGRYTVVLPPDPEDGNMPNGAGWATLTVSASGVASLVGALADGSAISASATVSKDGVLPIYRVLFAPAGSIAGKILFRAGNGSDLDGTYLWTKPERPTSRTFPGAFSAAKSFIGSRYTAPVSGQTVLPVSSSANNLIVTVTGGNLESPVAQPATLATNNRVTIPTPLLKGFATTITASTGRFSGSFADPTTKAVRRYYGVLLQKQGRGFGYFLGTDSSGHAELAPGGG